MLKAAIRIDNLSVMLAGHVPALTSINVDIEQGKIIGLIGPSGAGKTTLMRVLVGRLRPSAGKVEILGLAAGSKPLRSRVSYMTQAGSVYPDLTVQENLKYFAVMYGVGSSELSAKVSDILAVVDMTRHARHLVSQLSGGQKQRVSLAIALIGAPELMVLDEPTVGLDPVLRVELWKLFRKLASAGTTVVVSSHAMDEAEHCDDLLLIRNGGLLAHGTPSELCQMTHTNSVEASFLKLVGDRS